MGAQRSGAQGSATSKLWILKLSVVRLGQCGRFGDIPVRAGPELLNPGRKSNAPCSRFRAKTFGFLSMGRCLAFPQKFVVGAISRQDTAWFA